MKSVILFCISAIALSCTPSENKEQALRTDTTAAPVESVVSPAANTEPVTNETPILKLGTLIINGSDTIMEVGNQWQFISDPYDFSLTVETIKELLGEDVEVTEENYEGGEDYDAYTYYSLKSELADLRFYSYPGKHSCDITTSLLPLKNGVKIGMTKHEFMTALNFTGDTTSYANRFSLSDDYGQMDFRFRADTLYSISGYWEEGD